MSQYPEHDKMAAVQETSQTAGEFLDWLMNESKYAVVEADGHDWYLTSSTIQTILAEWLGIDRKKLEAEKAQMLEAMREMQKA